MFPVAALTRHPALYLMRCPVELKTFHFGKFSGESPTRPVQANGNAIGTRAED